MMGISGLLAFLGAARPFAGSTTVTVILIFVWLMVRPRRSQEDINNDRAEAERAAALYRENADQRARIVALEHDRDTGWNLSRWWCATAHHYRHWSCNLLMLVPQDKRPPEPPELPHLEHAPGLSPQELAARYVTKRGAP
jgi:hypothetical protein